MSASVEAGSGGDVVSGVASVKCPACGHEFAGTGAAARSCPGCGWVAAEAEPQRSRVMWGRRGAVLAVVVIAAVPLVTLCFPAEIFVAWALAVGAMSSRISGEKTLGRWFVVWCSALPWLMLPLFGFIGYLFPWAEVGGDEARVRLGAVLAGSVIVAIVGWPLHFRWLRARAELTGSAHPMVIGAAVTLLSMSLPLVVFFLRGGVYDG